MCKNCKPVEVGPIWSSADFQQRKHEFADKAGPDWRMTSCAHKWETTEWGNMSVVYFEKIDEAFSLEIESIFQKEEEMKAIIQESENVFPEPTSVYLGRKREQDVNINFRRIQSKEEKNQNQTENENDQQDQSQLTRTRLSSKNYEVDVSTKITKIYDKTIFQDGHRYTIGKSDLDLDLNGGAKLIKKGGFASVYLLMKKCDCCGFNSVRPEKVESKFILKMTENSVDCGSFNGLEINILKELSHQNIGPYIDSLGITNPSDQSIKNFMILLKYYEYDLNEVLQYFDMKKPYILPDNRLFADKCPKFYEKLKMGSTKNSRPIFLPPAFLELLTLSIFETLYALIDKFAIKDKSELTDNPFLLKTISHGDIKPGNILISFQNGNPKIDLTDYGTCGPDETIEEMESSTTGEMMSKTKSCIFAGTKLYLPDYRWGSTKDEQESLQSLQSSNLIYNSCSFHDATTTASKVSSRKPRLHGNADDFYAFGITLLEFFMSESILTLDNNFYLAKNYQLFSIFENSGERFDYYNEKVPDLVKLLKESLEKPPLARNENFFKFRTSTYYETLSSSEKRKEMKHQVNLFFAILPDKNDKKSWREKVLNLLETDYTCSDRDQNKCLKLYCEEEIITYFGSEMKEHFFNEMSAFVNK